MVKNYLRAGLVGFIAATLEFWLAKWRAGSKGAESDALHAYSDCLFFFFSAALELWKRYDKRRFQAIDTFGMWINNLYLISAGFYILYDVWRHFYAGQEDIPLNVWFMLLAGVIGMTGNWAQFKALGQTSGKHDMHHSNWSHVLSDMMNSASIVVGSMIMLVMSLPINFLLQAGVSSVLIAVYAYAAYRFLEVSTWKPGGQAGYVFGSSVAVLAAFVLVVNGSERDIDNVIAVSMAYLAMIHVGTRNLIRRYRKDGNHHDHGHDHHHHGHSH